MDECDSGVEDVRVGTEALAAALCAPSEQQTISSFKAVTTTASELISLATVIIHKLKVPFVVFKGSSLQPPLSRLKLYRGVRLFLLRMHTSCRLNVIHRDP